ncbi:DUF4147 domain-containing protein [Arcobacteraceae bacterium]|nr:DUF4147 domain-containing protein [Arcobacteraceae bacterium]
MLNKKNLLDVITHSLEAINPATLIEKNCSYKDDILTIQNKSIKLPKEKKVYILGSGKAVQSMANSIHTILGDKVEKMLLVGPYEKEINIKNVEYCQSTHPLPSEKSLDAALKMTEELKKLKRDDIFIYLLSGGTSALMELPSESITLDDFIYATTLMLKNSMPIEAINCVRKHLSQVKGGRLSSLTDASGYVLVLSDVLGDNLEDIGSSPFYHDKTTFQDAVNYLNKYNIFDQLPVEIRNYLIDGCNKKVEETLKNESSNVKHFIIGSNRFFLHSIQENLNRYNIVSKVYENSIIDEVSTVTKNLVEFTLKESSGCFIFGGEATVLVKGDGQGGRNQHLVLDFLNNYPDDKEITFLSVASDGIDGNSVAAGAIIEYETLQKVEISNGELKDALKRFDSYNFFKKIDCLIETGPTHNNMLDAVIIYIK